MAKKLQSVAERINNRVQEEIVDLIDWEEVEEEGVYEADVAFDTMLSIIREESGFELNEDTAETFAKMIDKLCNKYDIPISMDYESIVDMVYEYI